MEYIFMGYRPYQLDTLGLDLFDLAIIQWFTDYIEFGLIKSEIVDGEKYYHFSHDQICHDLPFIKLQQATISKRLTKIVETGVLKKYIFRQKGLRVLYTFGENYKQVIEIKKPRKSSKKKAKKKGNDNLIAPDKSNEHSDLNAINSTNHTDLNAINNSKTIKHSDLNASNNSNNIHSDSNAANNKPDKHSDSNAANNKPNKHSDSNAINNSKTIKHSDLNAANNANYYKHSDLNAANNTNYYEHSDLNTHCSHMHSEAFKKIKLDIPSGNNSYNYYFPDGYNQAKYNNYSGCPFSNHPAAKDIISADMNANSSIVASLVQDLYQAFSKAMLQVAAYANPTAKGFAGLPVATPNLTTAPLGLSSKVPIDPLLVSDASSLSQLLEKLLSLKKPGFVAKNKKQWDMVFLELLYKQRLSTNELVDVIYWCFMKSSYWSNRIFEASDIKNNLTDIIVDMKSNDINLQA